MKRLDPKFVSEQPKAPITNHEHMSDLAAHMAVGNRCEVNPGGKRGEVRYIGKVPAAAPGWWVGVQYDEPVGKNNGSIMGQRYFECAPKHGGFLRPDKVSVGEYLELCLSDESDDQEESASGAAAMGPSV